jgi:hypothetical protein
MLLEMLKQLLLLCRSGRPKGGPVIHRLALHAIDGDQHIWLASVVHIGELQGHHGLISVGTQHAGGGQHASPTWIASGKFDDGAFIPALKKSI